MRCGTICYDRNTHMCCESDGRNVIHSILEGSNCCGLTPYFAGFQLCCNGVLHEISTDTDQCCGTSVYDSSMNTCNNGEVVRCFPNEWIIHKVETIVANQGNGACYLPHVYMRMLCNDSCSNKTSNASNPVYQYYLIPLTS